MKILTCILTITALVFASRAFASDPKPNYTADGSDVPATQWETNAVAGVSYAVILSTETHNDTTYNVLVVYIKNISSSPKYFAKFGRDKGFRFFFTDAQGVQHDLHTPPRDRVENAVHLSFIKPGEIETQRVELDSADLLILKANPIQCSIEIAEATTDVRSKLISSPKTFSLPQ